jgi:hypothetical protein
LYLLKSLSNISIYVDRVASIMQMMGLMASSFCLLLHSPPAPSACIICPIARVADNDYYVVISPYIPVKRIANIWSGI